MMYSISTTGLKTYLDEPYGVKTELKGIRFTETSFDVDYVTMNYEVIGEGAEESIALLKEVFPRILFVDPQAERAQAHAAYIQAIEKNAVEKYKRENGLT